MFMMLATNLHVRFRTLLQTVDQLVKEMLVHCKYRNLGCTAEIALQNYKIHVASCAFGPSHCIHSTFGCQWLGTRSSLSNHLASCVFEQLKDFLKATQDTVASLKTQMEVIMNESTI
jgi:hypothetical protein